ncbi:MAG: formylmethanofuran dehydrogenase subunit C [ANME-2 cluster archaeon]|nr:formylmethanofuran dehydrogenase subunit C [ANME-2 cluster archaeon]
MQTVTLVPKEQFKISVEGEVITPDYFAGKSGSEIGALIAYEGNMPRPLSELFEIKVNGSAETADDVKIEINGNVARVKRIGEGMTGGRIMIEGDVDMRCGAKMKGGIITIKGNADSWVGQEMTGGEINVQGNAAFYVGSGYRGESCGMRGGKITVFGNANDFAGEHMCGGEIVIKGNAGIMPGLSNKGGRIVIEGNTTMPGSEMTKGTIIVKGEVENMMPVYQREGIEAIDGVEFTKYVGDVIVSGKGELFVK